MFQIQSQSNTKIQINVQQLNKFVWKLYRHTNFLSLESLPFSRFV